MAKWLEIGHKTTRLFSPWQNSKVERSHRRNGEGVYHRSFRTIEVLCEANKRYISTITTSHNGHLDLNHPMN